MSLPRTYNIFESKSLGIFPPNTMLSGSFRKSKCTTTLQEHNARYTLTGMLKQAEKAGENSTKLFSQLEPQKKQVPASLSISNESGREEDCHDDISVFSDVRDDKSPILDTIQPVKESYITVTSSQKVLDPRTSSIHIEHREDSNNMSKNQKLRQSCRSIENTSLSDPNTEMVTEKTTPDSVSKENRSAKEIDALRVLFRCTLQYMVLTNRLKIEIHMTGSLSRERDNKGGKLYSKLCMKPGKTKLGHDLDIAPLDISSSEIPRAYFQNMEEHELEKKKIDIRIYRRRGRFMKDKFLHRWSIDLDVVKSYDPVTVWTKVDLKR